MAAETEFRARSLRIDEAEVDIDEATRQFVIVPVERSYFACEGMYVKEILQQSPITFVPGLPDHFLGMIHLRGNLESVVDLAIVLKLGKIKPAPLNRLLMIRSGEWSTALMVDYVHDIVDVPQSKIRNDVKQTSPERSELFLGEFQWNEQIVVILDLPLIVRRLSGEA